MVLVDWNMTPQEWERALGRCQHATYFHTEAWLRTVSLTFGSRIERVRLTLPDGRSGYLPLSIRPLAKGLLPLAYAGETGAYSGLVSLTPWSPEDAALAYAVVHRRYPNMWVVGNPFAPSEPTPGLPGRVETDFTHVLELGPIAELRKGFSRGCRARGNKARNLGLELRVSTDPADVSAFYPLYEDSVRRWGEQLTWARPRAFFDHLMAESGGKACLFLAYQGERPISGLLFVAHGGVAHYLAGATSADAMAACPSNFLMEAAMAHYAEAGFHYFDFGPSNGLDGVIQFKESFGAQRVPFETRRATSPSGQLYFALRRQAENWRAFAAQLGQARRRPGTCEPQPAPAGT